MSQTWQTVLLSLATSLIVSLVTFILDLKSGKNQADRAKLQDMYRDLYSHFSDLKDCLNRNQPRTWQSYKKVERGFYRTEYYPPVKELKRTGNILFLKKKLHRPPHRLPQLRQGQGRIPIVPGCAVGRIGQEHINRVPGQGTKPLDAVHEKQSVRGQGPPVRGEALATLARSNTVFH